MTNWTAPKAKPRKRFVSRQMVMAAKAVEQDKIDMLMGEAENYDKMNLACADHWLKQRATIGDDNYRIQYALRVMKRLRPEIEL